MMRERHITWDNFRETFLDPGVPALHPVLGTPSVEYFVDAAASRLGLRAGIKGKSPTILSPLSAITVGEVSTASKRHLHISTNQASLFPQFYSFLTDLADRIQIQKRPPAQAVAEALKDWKTLLHEQTILSPEARLGLTGELWLLDRLLGAIGISAMDAWVAGKRENHDFRIGNRELEVKTTLSRNRDHIINGLDQLSPSLGKQLFIVSIQVEVSGARSGLSLPERIDRIRKLLKGSPPHLLQFEAALTNVGYKDQDADHYSERMALRTKPALVPVRANCPRLTSEIVSSAIGKQLAARIREVHYRANLDGLGHLDGTRHFLKVIPASRVRKGSKR